MKMYPFSAKKYAHDIFLVANRAYNLMTDAEERQDYKLASRMQQIRNDANELLIAIQDGMQGCSGVTMLTGQMIGRAKEMVVIAEELRSEMNH